MSFGDPRGHSKTDKFFGLPKKFWRWYHRNEKKDGDADLTKDQAEALKKEWDDMGQPGPDGKGKKGNKEEGFVTPEALVELIIPWFLTPTSIACGELDCNQNGIPDHLENPATKSPVIPTPPSMPPAIPCP